MSALKPNANPDSDPALMTAGEILGHYRRRTLSPTEVVSAIQDRIERFDGSVNAFVLRTGSAMAEAALSDARWKAGRPKGILDGIPCTVKDIMDLKGFPTRAGSLTTSAAVAADDAPAVIGLKNAGAIILGKTATTEFGWKAPGDSPHSGITRNPWNLAYTPGGSSCGAGAAGAACFGPLHIGTDGGGSIRVPAAWSGLFGLKPTYGRVAQWPLGAFAHVACVGPMARSSFDVALMLSAIAGEDLRDPFCLPNMNADFHESVDHSVTGLRVAVVTSSGSYHADACTAASVEHAAAILKDAGCTIHHVDLPLFSLREAFDAQWGLALARLIESLPVEARAQLDPAMLLLAKEHASMSAVEFLDSEVAFARFATHMVEFHRDYDLLLCPVVPSQAPLAETILQNADDARWTRWGIWTFPFNVSRQPAMSVPMGVGNMGLPTAVQIIAARFADRQVLRAARAIESQCPPTFPALESSTAN